MGQGQDSSRLTLARVEKLAEQIKAVGDRAHEHCKADVRHSYILGGVESVLEQLVGETCGQQARALIEEAFHDAYTPRAVEQAAEVAA